MSRYRGRHRRPTKTETIVDNVVDNSARLAAATVTTGILTTTGPLFFASDAFAEAPEGVRNAIAQCESGGNARVQNAHSTASGLYQFVNGTWAAYGGREFAPTAKQASAAQQTIVFNRAYAAQGTTPWNASKGCWSGKIGTATPKRDSGRSAPQTGSGKRRATEGRASNGSGSYTCDTARLYFEACDPDTLGKVVNYPLYKHGKRAAGSNRGTYTCDSRHLYYEACDPDNLGAVVSYPRR